MFFSWTDVTLMNYPCEDLVETFVAAALGAREVGREEAALAGREYVCPHPGSL